MTGVLAEDEQSQLLEPGAAQAVHEPTQGAQQPTLRIRVSNELPSKLVVPGLGGRLLVLSPLEQHFISREDLPVFAQSLSELEDRRCVTVDKIWASEQFDESALLGVVILATIGFLVAGAFFGSVLYWSLGVAAIAVAVLALVVRKNRKTEQARGTREPGTIWFQRLFWPLLIVLVVGVSIPAASVYFGGGVHEAVDVIRNSNDDELAYLTLIGRGLQAVLISIASLLPALLYFLFDRMKVETLRRSFEQDIFRFDPKLRTLSDVRARYGTLMDELYGRDDSATSRLTEPAPDPVTGAAPKALPRSSRVLPGRLAPVWVATVVITSGWILSLLNPDVTAPLQGSQQVVLLFEPQRSPVVFGFLGAYVFALQSLLRSYLRADLRPKSYTHITVRIFIAVIFAWILELLFSSTATPTTTEDLLLVLAFVVGILPETLLVRLQESIRHLVGDRFKWMPTLYEQYPLNRLEGIDIYDRSRLIEEGVGNIEGLAHHNLPELMMQTRIPVARLVHWTDQAILFLHVATATGSTAPTSADRQPDQIGAAENGEDDQNRQTIDESEERLRILQTFGIQTATDLENVYKAAVRRDEERRRASEAQPRTNGAPSIQTATDAPAEQPVVTDQGDPPEEGLSEADALLAILGSIEREGGRRLPRLRVILDAIADEEWMAYLTYWHDTCHRERETLTLADGKLVATQDPARPPHIAPPRNPATPAGRS